MCLCSARPACFLSLLLAAASANAIDGYVLGVSAEADTQDGRAYSGIIDIALSDKTWLSTTLSRTTTGGGLGGLDTLYTDLSLEHDFGPLGVRVGGAYWGDADILDSVDARGSVFFRGQPGSLSFDYERRNFDFVFTPFTNPDLQREVSFHADGIGGSAWLNAGERTAFFVRGISYDYSRNIRLDPNVDSLLQFSRSRLSLMNSLIDYRVSGGVTIRINSNALDLSVSNWRAALDGGHVNSFAIGYTFATSDAFDLDLRLAYDDAENFGSTVALAVSLFYFGG